MTAEGPAPAARPLRVATLNLCSGRDARGRFVDDTTLTAAVASLDADVVALQEVDVGQPRSGGTDQAAAVARALDAEHRFARLVDGTPGEPGWRPAAESLEPAPCAADPAPPPGGPGYGIALVSRRPVASWHVLRLPPVPGRWPLPAPGGPGGAPRLLWLPDEPRAVLAARLADPPVVVATTHLSFVPGVNAWQLARAGAWAARLAGEVPCLLLGDLNLPAPVPRLLTGWTPLVDGATFPAARPGVQLDHVLLRRPDGGTGADTGADTGAAGRLVPLPVGDHLAAVVDLAPGR